MTTMREELDKLLRTMECYDYDADEYKGRHAVHSFAAMLATVLIKNDAHLANGSHQALFTGIIDGSPVALHGTIESVRSLDTHLAKGAQVPDDTIDAITKAMRRAWSLGQTYWQQADSESYSQNKKADETYAKFDQLLTDTKAMLSQRGEDD